MNGNDEKGNSRWVPVRVECYSGARANERPRWIFTGGQRLEIFWILSETVLEEKDQPGSRGRLFKVVAEDAGTYSLRHLEREDRWLLKPG